MCWCRFLCNFILPGPRQESCSQCHLMALSGAFSCLETRSLLAALQKLPGAICTFCTRSCCCDNPRQWWHGGGKECRKEIAFLITHFITQAEFQSFIYFFFSNGLLLY